MELPSPVSGIVAEHLVAPGEVVPLGAPLAIVAAARAELESYEPRGG